MGNCESNRHLRSKSTTKKELAQNENEKLSEFTQLMIKCHRRLRYFWLGAVIERALSFSFNLTGPLSHMVSLNKLRISWL